MNHGIVLQQNPNNPYNPQAEIINLNHIISENGLYCLKHTILLNQIQILLNQ